MWDEHGLMDSPANYLDLKLESLLKLHGQQQLVKDPKVLQRSLGDAYLYTQNPVFKNIRDQFLKIGGTFTTEDFCHYQVFPYASLPQILKLKKVPYANNVSVLEEIESLHPKRFTCAELIKVKPNYTLHESSHCVADFYLEKISAGTFLSDLKISAESKNAFRWIMAESFANAVESFANAFCKTSAHRLFFELNSYVTHSKKVNSSLQQCLELIGPTHTFSVIYVSYLYANCLLPMPSHKQYQQLLEILIPDTQLKAKAIESAAVRKIFAHGFELSLDFRMQTTGFFCAYMGINTPLEKLLLIDVAEVLRKTKCVQDFLSCTHFG